MAVAKEQIRQIISENNITSVADVYTLLRDSFKDILQTATAKASAAKTTTTTAKASAAKTTGTTTKAPAAKTTTTATKTSATNNAASKKTSNHATTTTQKAVSNSVSTVKSAATNSASQTPAKGSSAAKSAVSASRAPTTNTAVRAAASPAVKGVSVASPSATKKTTNRTTTTTQKTVSNSVNTVKSVANNPISRVSTSTTTKEISSTVTTKKTPAGTPIADFLDDNNPFTSAGISPYGITYGGVFTGHLEGPSFSLQHGVKLCDVSGNLIEIGGDYENLNWNICVGGSVTAKAGVEYSLGGGEIDSKNLEPKSFGPRLEYFGYDAEASLISATVEFKIPLQSLNTDKKLILGVSGKAFSFGGTSQLDVESTRKIKGGTSALFGANFTIGIGE